MKNILNYSLVLVSMMALALPSCKKALTKNTYTLTGRMLKDCGGVPLSNYQLRLRFFAAGLGTVKSEILGDVHTDANGYFRFENIPTNRRDNLSFDNTSNYPTLVKWGDGYEVGHIPKNGEVVDVGVFYESFYEISKLDIRFGSVYADTFYVGRNRTHFLYIFPAKDTVVYFKEYYSGYGLAPKSPYDFNLNWAFKKSIFDTLGNNTFMFKAPVRVCTEPPATIVNIP